MPGKDQEIAAEVLLLLNIEPAAGLPVGPHRHPVRPGKVGRQRLKIVQQDVDLLVPVGIELDPALLHEHPAIVLPRVAKWSGNICLHPPLLTGMNDPGLHPGRHEVVEPGLEVGFPLRLIQVVDETMQPRSVSVWLKKVK